MMRRRPLLPSDPAVVDAAVRGSVPFCDPCHVERRVRFQVLFLAYAVVVRGVIACRAEQAHLIIAPIFSIVAGADFAVFVVPQVGGVSRNAAGSLERPDHITFAIRAGAVTIIITQGAGVVALVVAPVNFVWLVEAPPQAPPRQQAPAGWWCTRFRIVVVARVCGG